MEKTSKENGNGKEIWFVKQAMFECSFTIHWQAEQTSLFWFTIKLFIYPNTCTVSI